MRTLYILACLCFVISSWAQPTGSPLSVGQTQRSKYILSWRCTGGSARWKNHVLLCTKTIPENTLGTDATQDIWMSKQMKKGVWSAPKHLTANQNKLNQVFTVFNDGSHVCTEARNKMKLVFLLVIQWRRKQPGHCRFCKMCKGRFWGASMSAEKTHADVFQWDNRLVD